MDKRERAIQMYGLLRTARLNVLYYEESLRRWTWAVRAHDFLVGISGVSSPIAFLKRSNEPIQLQAWFYLTLASGVVAVLKPVFRWDKEIALNTELVTHYRELFHDLKCVVDDFTAEGDISSQLEKKFQSCRLKENSLQKKEPPPSQSKISRLQKTVEREYDMAKVWLPRAEEQSNVE